jgi:hypothetical protein
VSRQQSYTRIERKNNPDIKIRWRWNYGLQKFTEGAWITIAEADSPEMIQELYACHLADAADEDDKFQVVQISTKIRPLKIKLLIAADQTYADNA